MSKKAEAQLLEYLGMEESRTYALSFMLLAERGVTDPTVEQLADLEAEVDQWQARERASKALATVEGHKPHTPEWVARVRGVIATA